jgi:hypothetical protein
VGSWLREADEDDCWIIGDAIGSQVQENGGDEASGFHWGTKSRVWRWIYDEIVVLGWVKEDGAGWRRKHNWRNI